MNATTYGRLPLARILSEFGDYDGRNALPAGWTHLPAANGSPLDFQLRQAAGALRVPYGRYLAKMYRLGYRGAWEKLYTGVVVPADRAGDVARLADLAVAGEVSISGERVTPRDVRRLRIEWVDAGREG